MLLSNYSRRKNIHPTLHIEKRVNDALGDSRSPLERWVSKLG